MENEIIGDVFFSSKITRNPLLSKNSVILYLAYKSEIQMKQKRTDIIIFFKFLSNHV